MSAPFDAPALLRQMFDAAVASAQPALCLPPHLPRPEALGAGRLVVIGAGKAAAAMAQAVERVYAGDHLTLTGLVVTRYGHGLPCERIEVLEAAHPVPDAAGEAAARRMLAQVQDLSPEDTVLCLISGGGSALLPLPLTGVTLQDKQALSRALLASGAPISEINRVRRHLSAIKGGRLAAACHPARVLTLAISDVPGDDPLDIASGPTVADPSTCADALAVLARHGIKLPPSVRAVLESGQGESLKPGDPRLARAGYRLIATPQQSLLAAAAVAQAAGCRTVILGDAIEGEAREVGAAMAAQAVALAAQAQDLTLPCVLLSGGETTVTLRGEATAWGSGGRNVEFLLALGLALDGHPQVHALAADTDGVDGLAPVAGARWSPDTLTRARALGWDPAAALARHDGHGFFGALGDAVITGPTHTNVNDFRAILILPP